MTATTWDRDRLLRLCPPNPVRAAGRARPVPQRLSGRVRSVAGWLTVSAAPRGGSQGEVWAVGQVCGLTADAACKLLDLIGATEATQPDITPDPASATAVNRID